MITNGDITYYKKTFNAITKLEEWQRYYFKNVWAFRNIGSRANDGIENANVINVRIPIECVEDTSIFTIGSIIAIGNQGNITKQNDLREIEFYNITKININKFGNNQHVHLEGQ